MMKKRTKGVLVYLVRDLLKESQVLVIKYKNGGSKGYYDIPGSEVSKEETLVETAANSFKKDTGIEVTNLVYKGNAIFEYPNEIYDLSVYVTRDYNYEQKPKDFETHTALWMPVEKVIFQEKTFPTITLLSHMFKDQVRVHMYLDNDERLISIEEK